MRLFASCELEQGSSVRFELRPLLEGAYNRTSDLGLIARTLWTKGAGGLDELKVTVGKPLRCQLAERLPNPEAVIKKLGLVGVQPKYDGFRVLRSTHLPYRLHVQLVH